MWKLFSTDPLSNFKYSLGKSTDKDIFTTYANFYVCECKEKKTGQDFTAFVYEGINKSSGIHALCKIRSMRYPGIVQYVDSLDTKDALYIITEKCVPLYTFKNEATAYCLENDVCILGFYDIMIDKKRFGDPVLVYSLNK
ncbi:hypothetical protein A3Q56_00085 [Intoshia linei]|uniref:Uncharacterized protein n=1 Tax=Intoshia linei TaxID=1819745 RepID=A0A177BF83_9BILA|nr:hypothetical protein A3Q56_00085 [Intoshia linei]